MKLSSPIALAALVLVAFAAAAYSEPTSKPARKDFKEIEVYLFGKAQERDSLFLSANGGGMTVKDHNYLVTVKNAVTGEVKSAVLIGAKDHPMAKIITDAKSGDLVTMDLQMQLNNVYIRAIAPYALGVGEDRPGVFLFTSSETEKVNGADATVVKLYKLGKLAPAAVPSVRDKESGKMVPDPAMMKIIEKLTPGESIEVTTSGGAAATLKSIEPYTAPQAAVFTKATEADVEGGKAAAIEVSIDGTATTILIPGKLDAKGAWSADSRLAAEVKPFKEGDKITVRMYRALDGKNWLREAAKGEPAKTPAK